MASESETSNYAGPLSSQDANALRQSGKFGSKLLRKLGTSRQSTAASSRGDTTEMYSSRTRELHRKRSNGEKCLLAA